MALDEVAVEIDQREAPGLRPRPAPWSGETGAGRRLVYLLSRYPAISHTFFLNEILELRKLGFTIDVASINGPDRSLSALPEVEAREAGTTFYVKPSGAARAAWIALKTVVTRPQVFGRGLLSALELGGSDLVAFLFALFYLAEALILGDWMRRHDHRHLHIHFSGPVATVGLIASKAWGFPYSLTVHGPDEFYDVERFRLREKIAQARFIVCISDFCRSQLMRLADPPHWNKMHVVRLGVDLEAFSPAGQLGDEVPEILCVGRLVPSKGQLILLHACNILLAQGHSFCVRFVGSGPDRRRLEAYASERGMPAVFEGAKDHHEVLEQLGRADVFALASFAEGVPVALMEAMAMEVPCVSTCIAGIPELIRDGVDGLLVPASSAESLAAALGRLLASPELRQELGAAGRRRVCSRFNLRDNVQALAAVFDTESVRSAAEAGLL